MVFLSRDYRGKKVVVYPQYIDSSKSRSEGRKIPKTEAVPRPSIEEIFKAAEQLGLHPEIEKKSYPREWWIGGRVIIDKTTSKVDLLKKISRKIKELRR